MSNGSRPQDTVESITSIDYPIGYGPWSKAWMLNDALHRTPLENQFLERHKSGNETPVEVKLWLIQCFFEQFFLVVIPDSTVFDVKSELFFEVDQPTATQIVDRITAIGMSKLEFPYQELRTSFLSRLFDLQSISWFSNLTAEEVDRDNTPAVFSVDQHFEVQQSRTNPISQETPVSMKH